MSLFSLFGQRPVFDATTLGSRFEQHRATAQLWLAWVTAAAVLPIAATAGLNRNGTLAVVAILGLLIALAALALQRRGDLAGRVGVAALMAGQCVLFNVAMIGTEMQDDAHMLYFAALPAIGMMASRPALLWAMAVMIGVQAVLALALPDGTGHAHEGDGLIGALLPVAFHAAFLALTTGLLVIQAQLRLLQTFHSERRNEKLEATMAEVGQAMEEARRQGEEARRATQRAEAAGREAEEARKRAEQALSRAEENASAARAAEARTAETQNRHAAEIEEVIAHLQGKLSDLAQGDLTTRIDRPLPAAFADLSQSFNVGVARLEEAFAAVQDEVVSIRTQSQEINGAAESLGRRTERQVTTLSEAAGTLQKLTELIREIDRDTGAARRTTEETRGEASSGTEVMERTVSAMDQIEGSSSAIRKIITVIDDIAFQTNLLALNAGVEAARAGDAGRGFAVVANEVRALAQRSSEAAKEIDTLINSSAGHVSRGVDLVKSTGAALTSIREAVERTSARIEAVAEATSDQARGLGEVNAAIAELETFTQRNAAIFEETISANAVLSDTADALAGRVNAFRIGRQPPAGDTGWSFDSPATPRRRA